MEHFKRYQNSYKTYPQEIAAEIKSSDMLPLYLLLEFFCSVNRYAFHRITEAIIFILMFFQLIEITSQIIAKQTILLFE